MSAIASPSIEDRPLSHDQKLWKWRVLTATYFAYAGYYLCRKAFTICKTSIKDEFGWDFDRIAHIWTAYLAAYMVGQFLNSFIGRKWGPRVLVLGGLGISMGINLAFGFANSYGTFMGFMIVNGLVQATGWPGVVGGVAQWLRKKERGAVMGVWSTSYMLGNILVKTLGGYLLGAMGWRYAFFGCTAATLVIWWMLYLWQRDKPEDVGLPPIVGPSADDEDRDVQASDEDRIGFKEYAKLLLNPIVPIMGLSYFSIKFLRYALDSWLPTFLNLQGFAVDKASYYSMIFDYAGIGGAIVTGFALDKIFNGRWAPLCFVLGVGMTFGYWAVSKFGASPYAMSVLYGFVGFMLYGADSLLCGAAAVQVAGPKNAVAVAGLVNGIGSIGAVIQEELIGKIMAGKETQAAIDSANLLTLGISAAFVLTMAVILWQEKARHGRKRRAAGGGR